MPRVICNLTNASNLINGVNFIAHKHGMISEEIDQETASVFLAIPGFVDNEDAKEEAKEKAKAAAIAAAEIANAEAEVKAKESADAQAAADADTIANQADVDKAAADASKEAETKPTVTAKKK